MMDRQIVCTVPIGSKNYNVNDTNSDDDFKTYLYPTFDDMYHNRDFTKAYTGEVDHEFHDVRKMSMMLWKANINFIEALFPYRVETTSELYEELVNMRDDIASMNLPYLYDACFGMYFRKMKDFNRDIAYNDLSDKDAERKLHKHGATAFRTLDFLERFADNRFEDFGAAMRYQDAEPNRHLILEMRASEYSSGAILNKLHEKQARVELRKPEYRERSLNEEAKVKMERMVKHFVETEIMKEIRD